MALVYNPQLGRYIDEDVPTEIPAGADATTLLRADTAQAQQARLLAEQTQLANQTRQTQLMQNVAAARGVNAALAQPYLPAERGNYNMTNTDPSQLAQPVGEGLNFGFGTDGSPTAAQYLQQMAVQDRQDQATRERRAVTREVMDAQARLTPNASIGEIAAARSRLAALTPILGAQTEGQGRAIVADTGAQAAAYDADSRLAATDIQARAEVLSRLAAADITGQYGVAAAQAKSAGAIQEAALKAVSPEGRLAGARAALAETQLNAINDLAQSGQVSGREVVQLARPGQTREPPAAIDPITGVPYTPEEIALTQRRRLLQLQQPTE